MTHFTMIIVILATVVSCGQKQDDGSVTAACDIQRCSSGFAFDSANCACVAAASPPFVSSASPTTAPTEAQNTDPANTKGSGDATTYLPPANANADSCAVSWIPRKMGAAGVILLCSNSASNASCPQACYRCSPEILKSSGEPARVSEDPRNSSLCIPNVLP